MKYMQAVGVMAHVDRAYQASGAYQWAREAVVNALQARATNIHFGIEWQGVQKAGVYRRTITDDGIGIPAQQMPAFLNKFGGSGKIIGDITGNYGIGFKTSCLPWNRFGVVVLSVTLDAAGSRCVNMMWLRQEEREDDGSLDYGARELLTDYFCDYAYDDADAFISEWVESFGASEDATTVLPLHLLKEDGYPTEVDGIDWWKVIPNDIMNKGHGTVIVLMGNDGKEHTIKGDASREHEGETKYGLLRYLNTRFYTLPNDATVSVTMLGSETKGGEWGDSTRWPKNPQSEGIGKREVIGLKEVLLRYAAHAEGGNQTLFESVTLTSSDVLVPVSIDTYLFPDSEKSARTEGGWNKYTSGTWPSLPLIANVRACHPELDLIEAFDARTLSEGKEALYRWINLDSLRKRLALILHPLDTEDMQVFPDQSRRTLLYQNKTKGGTPLPEATWAEAYKTKRPDFISQEINAYFSKLSTDSPDIDKSIVEKLKQYLPYMAVYAKERRRKGRVPSNNPSYPVHRIDAGGATHRRKKRHQRLLPPENGGNGDAMPNTRRGLIAVKCGETSDPSYPIELNFDQKEPTGIVNINHPFIQDAWGLCQIKLVADSVAEGAEMESYYTAFKGQVQGHVSLALTHIWAFLKADNWRLKDEMTKPVALAGIVAGIQPLRQAAQGPFGTIKAGRKK